MWWEVAAMRVRMPMYVWMCICVCVYITVHSLSSVRLCAVRLCAVYALTGSTARAVTTAGLVEATGPGRTALGGTVDMGASSLSGLPRDHTWVHYVLAVRAPTSPSPCREPLTTIQIASERIYTLQHHQPPQGARPLQTQLVP